MMTLAFLSVETGCALPDLDPMKYRSASSPEKIAAANADFVRLSDIFSIVSRPSSYAGMDRVERLNMASETRRLGVESGHPKAAGLALDIFNVMKSDGDEFVRKEVAHGFCWVGSMNRPQARKAAAAMKKMMNDPDEIIRVVAAECIASLKP